MALIFAKNRLDKSCPRQGKPLGQSIGLAKKKLKTYADHEETLAALELAQSLARRGISADDAIPQIGQGWIGEEAVAIAVYCALAFSRDYAGAVLAAVNIDGDSDSTGAITGAIVGTQVGIGEVPAAWVDRVEAAEIIRATGAAFLGAG